MPQVVNSETSSWSPQIAHLKFRFSLKLESGTTPATRCSRQGLWTLGERSTKFWRRKHSVRRADFAWTADISSHRAQYIRKINLRGFSAAPQVKTTWTLLFTAPLHSRLEINERDGRHNYPKCLPHTLSAREICDHPLPNVGSQMKPPLGVPERSLFTFQMSIRDIHTKRGDFSSTPETLDPSTRDRRIRHHVCH